MEATRRQTRLIDEPSMLEETDKILREIVRDKKIDCRKINKRKLSDSDHDQNHKDDRQICSKSKTVVDAEIEEMFDKVKRRKKANETCTARAGLLVEKVMALMEVAAEEDIELNRQNKPAVKKIQMLPLLTDYLSKKPLQPEFLDHGVLNLFKNWLEPLPDQSLPNATVRSSILNILTHVLPVDISSEDRKEQLKKSGLGKVIMFLSRSDEELTANRKLANDLVENWSRTIFNKSARYSDLRRNKEEEGQVLSMRPSIPKEPAKKKPSVLKQSTMEADFDLELRSKANDYNSAWSTGSVSVPMPSPRVYAINPQSNYWFKIKRDRKIGYTGGTNGKRRKRIGKNMKRLESTKKKSLMAVKAVKSLLELI